MMATSLPSLGRGGVAAAVLVTLAAAAAWGDADAATTVSDAATAAGEATSAGEPASSSEGAAATSTETAAEGEIPAPLLPGNTSLATWLVALPVILPLIGSGILAAFRAVPQVQAPGALIVMALTAVSAIALNGMVAADGAVVMAMGNWVPPFGIVLAVDPLGALFVTVSSLIGLVAIGYARFDIPDEGVRYSFYAFYLLLMCGVNGAFSTGDIFNLYVWFEVFLIASFGLMILGGGRVQMDGAVKYGVLNLIATTVFLIAIGALYGATGTLNMADIRNVLAAGEGTQPVITIGALFVLAFMMKAAAFPLHFWLPASYHTPRVVVSAVFAGLLTKIGIYAILRVVVMLFGDDGSVFLPLLGILGVATAIIGALGALAQTDLRRLAAFLVVSGIGVMLIGVGLNSAEGYTGAIVYAVHSMFAMTAIFLIIGATEAAGRTGTIEVAGGLYAAHGLIAGLFLVFGFAAAGLPPFSGFWPKLMLIDAALLQDGAYPVAAVVGVILSGILTTIAVGRVWALVFLKPSDVPLPAPGGAAAPPSVTARAATIPVASLVLFAALIVGLGVFPSVVVDPAQSGAAALLEPAAYMRSVLGGP